VACGCGYVNMVLPPQEVANVLHFNYSYSIIEYEDHYNIFAMKYEYDNNVYKIIDNFW
jgi:hypothetical protein